MLDPSSNPTFAGRFTPADANYPFGSSKDETAPAAGDGSPYFKARADDVLGFQQALVGDAGIVPNDNADTAIDSQQLRAASKLLRSGAFKNKAVNGDLGIFQRGRGPFATTDAQYYYVDQWKNTVVLDGGTIDGVTGVLEVKEFSPGQPDVPGATNYLEFNAHITGGGGGELVAQQNLIEDVITLSDGLAVFGFFVKGSLAGTAAIVIRQRFGTGGTPSAEVDVYSEPINITTGWVFHEIPIDSMPSINGKTLGTNNDSVLSFYLVKQAGATIAASLGLPGAIDYIGDLAIADFQPEEGRYSTPYERLKSPVTLARCQWYLRPPTSGFGVTRLRLGNTQMGTDTTSFPQMRILPGLFDSNNASITVQDIDANIIGGSFDGGGFIFGGSNRSERYQFTRAAGDWGGATYIGINHFASGQVPAMLDAGI